MRYNSSADGRLLRKFALGPVHASTQRQYALMIPGRGIGSGASRVTLRGFGGSYDAPIGQGAGKGAQVGAQQGAAVGSYFGPIGTAIGAVAGAIGGAIAGSINKKDPEQYNFDQAVSVWQQNPDAIYNIGNKYLPLAGLFDLHLKNPHIPIYLQYGRMGEQRFVNDLVTKVYQAGISGQITANDTPFTVMAKVVQPWIDSWGHGAMVDPHQDLINRLIVGMIWDYVTGAWKNEWFDIKGNFPFGNLPTFQLAASAAPAPTASPTPSPVPVPVSETPTTRPTTTPTDAVTILTPTGSTSTITSNAPPTIGAAIQYALDSATNQMMRLPAGATYGGVDANGRWIVVYSSGSTQGQYTLANGQLTPILTAASYTASIPAGFQQTTKSAMVNGVTYPLYQDAQGNTYVWTGGQMVPYSTAASQVGGSGGAVTTSGGSSGGGGGGFYPGYSPPTYSQPSVDNPPPIPESHSGFDPTWILWGAGAVGLYLLVEG